MEEQPNTYKNPKMLLSKWTVILVFLNCHRTWFNTIQESYPKEMKARAIPRALDRSDSSVYLSAIIERPAVSANAEPTP